MKNAPPYLISLYIEIIIKYVLVCLTFFQKQSTRVAGKKILPKFTNISVYICAWIHSSKQTVTKNDIFPV